MSVAYRLLSPDGAPEPRTDAPATLIVSVEGADQVAAFGEAVGASGAALDRSRTYDLRIADAERPLSNCTLSVVATLKLASVANLEGGGYRRPRREGAKTALFVFPGNFLPPRIGSHQRAFSTVLDLIEGGYDVDIVVKRRGHELFDRTRKYFDLIATGVFAYDETDERASLRPKRARTIAENEARDVNEGGRRLIGSLVEDRRYDLIVVSFSWMTGILERCQTGAAKIVCDAHDVAANRQTALSSPLDRLISGATTSLAREKSLLSRCDAVLAISQSDRALFESKLGLTNVAEHPLSYHLADAAIRPWPGGGPTRFGFIGSDMEANRRSLRMVLEIWWPAIRRLAPDATLTIAGAVTRSVPIPARARQDGVSAISYAEDLDAFYRGVDALLSPAAVQAGVNVKNVEALLRSCVVFTNAIGAQSLRPLEPPVVCDDAASLVAALTRLRSNDPALRAGYERLFAQARLRHAKPKPIVFD